MPIYDEAQQPSSTFPHITDKIIMPPNLDPSKWVTHQGLPNQSLRRGPTMQMPSPPATLSSIEAQVPASLFPAQIIKPLVLTPSVAGTAFNATPLSNITSIASDLRSGVRGRPLIPQGLRDRAADAMPPGMRQRAAVWSRAVARWRSPRPTSGGRVSRE